MSQSSHQSSVVITPMMLKQQIIIRLSTLVNKTGGRYFPSQSGDGDFLCTIEGMDIHGVETQGKELYFVVVASETGEHVPYNANQFYIEQIWEVYLACEPLYQSRFNDYATFQE